MIRSLAYLLLPLALLLAACGVDGAPVPPSQVEEDDAPLPDGVLISGSAEIGVGGRF